MLPKSYKDIEADFIPIRYLNRLANLTTVINEQYKVNIYERNPLLMFQIKPDYNAYHEIRARALAEAKERGLRLD